MKARSVFAAIALTAGLAFTQAPAQALPDFKPVSRVSEPVRWTPQANLQVAPIFRATKVRACFIGKRLVAPCPKPVAKAPKAKPGYLTFR